MTNITPYGKYLPYHSVYTNIQPFTYRDSRTFIERLEEMWEYLSTIAPEIDDAIGKVVELALTVHGDRTEMERILALFQNEYADFLATLDTATNVLEEAIRFRDEVENWLSSLIAVVPKINNILAYGAVGDGVTDARPAVIQAIADTPEGGTLFFPRGTYYTPQSRVSASSLDNWIVIDKPIHFEGEAGTVLKNFHFLIRGSAEPVHAINAAIEVGEREFNSSDTGLQAGDFFQIASEYNINSKDAKEFQSGEYFYETGDYEDFRASEFNQVIEVLGTSRFRTGSPFLYRYGTTSADLIAPIAGVTSSEVRKVNFVDGVSFSHIEFVGEGTEGNRIIAGNLARNTHIDNCSFVHTNLQGFTYSLTMSECLDTTVTNTTFRTFSDVDTTQPGTTMVHFSGGCQNTRVDNCDFYGGYACIDFTTLFSQSIVPVTSHNEWRCLGISSQVISVTNCTVNTSNTGITFHPGTYWAMVQGNRVIANLCIMMRGCYSMVSDNYCRPRTAGVMLAVLATGTSVMNNTIEESPGSNLLIGGILMTVGGGDQTTSTPWDGITIKGNSVRTKRSAGYALQFTYRYNTPEPENINKVSDIRILDNRFQGRVKIGNGFNGVTVIGNDFTGTKVENLLIDQYVRRTVVHSNTFDNAEFVGINVAKSDAGWGINRIGNNFYLGTTQNTYDLSRVVRLHDGGAIDAGSDTIPANSASGTNVEYTGTIQFDQPFTFPPRVIATPYVNMTAIRITAITATQFTYVATITNGATHASFSWIGVL